jgi:tetratricopeptide (TPR) repeat protein
MPRTHTQHTQKPRDTGGTEFQASYTLGLLCLQRKQFGEAIEHLSDALRLKAYDVPTLSNLGYALSALQRFDQALAVYDRAVAQQPDSAENHYNRANTLSSLARAADAVDAYDAALALEPAFAEAWANRGGASSKLGRNEAALASYDRALAIKPRLVEALFNRASVLAAMERPLDALAAFDKALLVESKSAAGYLMRGQLLQQLGRTEQALADFTNAARLDPRNATAHLLCGDRLIELFRSDEALKCFEIAIELDPGFAEAHDRRGMALVDIGRIAEARSAHETAVSLSPGKAAFYYNLTAVAGLKPEDPKFAAMRTMEQDGRSLEVEDQILLHFALARSYTDQGDYKLAFTNMRLGNALKRARIDYDERAILADMDNVRSTFGRKLLAKHRGRGNPSSTPVFVLGMPRSGSTLIEQILASCPKVHGAGEISDFVGAAAEVAGENLADLRAFGDDGEAFRDQLGRIGAGYLDRMRGRGAGADRIVDKMPDNFRLAGLIHLALPNARIIHTRRDPMDTCLSCYSKLFSANVPFAYDLGELGRYYRAYDAVMAHWRAVLPAEVLLEVSYENLVADPETQARRLVEHCGLGWDPRCLDFHRNTRFVRTASAVQVRKPIYTDAVARWTKFGADLAPLIAALGPRAPEKAAMQNADGRFLDRLLGVGGYLRRLCA